VGDILIIIIRTGPGKAHRTNFFAYQENGLDIKKRKGLFFANGIFYNFNPVA